MARRSEKESRTFAIFDLELIENTILAVYGETMTVESFNHLKDESSLYLKQHAENPIHWWAFGPEAIQKAKDSDMPIFMSIGYSSCHWCHVMEEEAFDDVAIAKLLNENFICIKVDREEFPDIDQYYQKAAFVFNQGGGWPLNLFLLPDMRPFFVGTYFPLEATDRLPSFKEVVVELSSSFKNERPKLEDNAQKAQEAIATPRNIQEKIEFKGHFPPPSAVLRALKELQDNENGGYGPAPKFPNFPFLEWAVEQIAENVVAPEFADHIIKTIDKICFGGIMDQIKGGIHRYTTDEKWMIPHFEKMLYDQAALLKVLSKLSLIYPSPMVYDSIIHCLDYLETEMLGEDGHYFFSGQDADSEGEEGLYFTFTEEEFDEALKSFIDQTLYQKRDMIKKWFGISKAGNFKRGLSVISLDEAVKKELFTPENWELVRKTRQALLTARKERIPPTTDNKGVASWNFQLISALCDVVQFTKIDVIRNMASKLIHDSLKHIHETFIEQKEKTQAQIHHCTTRKDIYPLLEDYVAFTDAQMRIYEITGAKIFKDNAMDALKFIMREFRREDRFITRAISYASNAPYENLEMELFDQSFRSPAATLIAILRRGALMFEEVGIELLDQCKDFIEYATQCALQNPLGHGELLRALTYPENIYRKVQVPRSWLQKAEFMAFIPHYSPRFVLDYHDLEDDSWQICTFNSCEFQGKSFDEFKSVFESDEGDSIEEK